MTRWAFDIDGVITANPDFFKWWTGKLKKSNHEVIILSSRNPERKRETVGELKDLGIKYDTLYMMSKSMARDYKTQGEWKLGMVNEIKADFWLDNDFKVYEEVCGVDFSSCVAERLPI